MSTSMTPRFAKQVEQRKRNAWRAAAERQFDAMRQARSELDLERRRRLPQFSKPGSFTSEREFNHAAARWWNEHEALKLMPEYNPPKVMTSPREPRPKRKIPDLMRDVILICEPICVYCHEAPSTTLDHIFPHSRGGADSYLNLVGACKPCNEKKSDKTLDEAGLPQPASERLEQPDGLPAWFHQLPLICFKADTGKVSPLHQVPAFQVRVHYGKLVFEALKVTAPWKGSAENYQANQLHQVISPSDIVVVARLHKKVRILNKSLPKELVVQSLNLYRPQLKAVRQAFPGLPAYLGSGTFTTWVPAPTA